MKNVATISGQSVSRADFFAVTEVGAAGLFFLNEEEMGAGNFCG